ncbi:MAG: diguanylate cyclase [Methylomonas sp.]|nr:diguanylate cyclase [Methylomonas sp.]
MTSKGIFVFVGLWLMVIGISYYQQAEDDKRFGQKIAYKQAETFFQHILLMRYWNAHHGGVYAPVTESNQPDPYLNIPERDITTREGKRYTLINPAYMSRQMAKMEKGKTGILYHITSLDPQRPEDKADDWEVRALKAFEDGKTSFSELSDIDGKSYYRYMAPLVLEPECTKCHNEPDKNVGGFRGAISVSLPSSSIEAFIDDRLVNLKRSHLVIAVTGVVALMLGYWAQSKLNRRLTKAETRLQLAYLDALTLLPNRRYYDAFLLKEWKRAMRHHYPLSLIMIDIDFFKTYNDSLGHQEGDRCLREVARTLRRYCRRSGDLIARYGGEEFCVVSACNSEQISQLADILRMAVEMMQLPHPCSQISKYVTISLGAATLIPNDKMQISELMHYADQSLYSAKQAGRNKVVKYKVEIEAPNDSEL